MSRSRASITSIVEARRRRGIGFGADDFDCGEIERAAEHRQPAQEPAVARFEQVDAPRDRRLECLLAGRRGARAAGEEPQLLVETTENLGDGHRLGARRRPARWPTECRRGAGRSRRSPRACRSGAANVGRTRTARSTNRRTASNCRGLCGGSSEPTGGNQSDGTRHATSPGTPRSVRVVVSTETCRQCSSTCAIRLAAASTRCSQLSSTRSA